MNLGTGQNAWRRTKYLRAARNLSWNRAAAPFPNFRESLQAFANHPVGVRICQLFLIGLLSLGGMTTSGGEVQISVAVDPTRSGPEIPGDYAGLSYEVAAILPYPDGHYYFSPTNQPLINVFQTLGIGHLRIGGNTSDRDAVHLPVPADFDSLFAFARAARVKVIYCMRLHHGSPAEAASTAKYLYDHYAEFLDAISIGQEPSAYPVETEDKRPANERMGQGAEHYSYEAYRAEWKRFAAAILEAVPAARFAGPGVHNNARWTQRFLANFGRSNHVGLATAHLYPGGAGGKVPTPEAGRARMLSSDFLAGYEKLWAGSLPAVRANSLAFRLEEVNNFYNGGAKDVSDTYAAALWGLEFMHWWAAHGAAGINFHTGDRVAAGANLFPSKYSAIATSANGYSVRPLGYGLQMFALGGHGRYVPVEFTGRGTGSTNISLFAVLQDDRTLTLTVINKSFGSEAVTAQVKVSAKHYLGEKAIWLTTPQGDVAVKTGMKVGGQGINPDGSWSGNWGSLNPAGPGELRLMVPPASAQVARLKPVSAP